MVNEGPEVSAADAGVLPVLTVIGTFKLVDVGEIWLVVVDVSTERCACL